MTGGRCPQHGLALSPDGTCVLCRRESPKGAGIPPWVVKASGVVVVGLALFAAARFGLRVWQSAEAPSVAVPDRLPAPPRPAVSSHTTAFASASPVTPATGGGHIEAFAGAPKPDWAAEQKSRLPEERKNVSITMYTTSWCPHCREARDWLDAHGQPYFERDIERDPDANARMRKLNPRGGVPTIDVEDQVIVGFDPGSLDHAIDLAAQRHLM